MSEDKKEKMVKIELKLRKRHPKKSFRLGRFVVGPNFKEFELNKKELVELSRKGCKAWLISREEEVAEKKAAAESKKKSDKKDK